MTAKSKNVLIFLGALAIVAVNSAAAQVIIPSVKHWF